MKAIATKIISFLLSICLLISLLPAQVVHATELNTLKETDIPSGNEIANIMPMSDTDTELLTLNVSKNVQISASGELKYYRFTPTATGFYTFRSTYIASGDPQGWIYNKNWEFMASNDDTDPGNHNFTITYHLIANTTYYYIAGNYESTAANYNIMVTNSSVYSPNVVAEFGNYITVPTTVAYESYAVSFKAQETKEYVFYTQKVSGDPQIWLYDSGRNIVGSNDNATYNTLEAWLSVELEAGEQYYLVLGHAQPSAGTYTTKLLREKNIESRGCAFKNDENVLYVDIHGPGEQIKVHQWSFHPNEWEAWKVEKHDNGYYTIQSAYGDRKYIGASGNSTSSDNILLYDNICNETYWKAYDTPDTGFVLVPYLSVARVLIPPNDNVGTELRLAWIFEVNTDRMYWSTEPRTAAQLEGQRQDAWCWVATARMFAKHYYYDLTGTQASIVTAIQGAGANMGGTEAEIAEAISLFTAYMPGEPLNLYYRDSQTANNRNPGILSEDALIRVLDNGDVVAIMRTERGSDGVEGVSHVTLITGYTTEYEGHTGEMMFIVYDPMPYPLVDWAGERDTIGTCYLVSYEWICEGNDNPIMNNNGTWFWEGFVTTQSNAFSENDIISPRSYLYLD